MTPVAEIEDRGRSIHLRALAEISAVTVTDGPAASGQLIEVRIPSGLAFDVALDQGGDIFRLSFRGQELGWHSAADAQTPCPSLEAEHGKAFLRGFDGLLITCGLDHHGVATEAPADLFRYPLCRTNAHPLHGRIMAAKAEVLENRLDWAAGVARIRLLLRQATVFGAVLDLKREVIAFLTAPWISLQKVVTNRGFWPTKHGLLYRANLGWPLLDEWAGLIGDGWALASALDSSQAVPADDHMEQVDAAPSPARGRVGLRSDGPELILSLDFDTGQFPVAAPVHAFQSGTYALGVESQARIDAAGATQILPSETRIGALRVTLEDACGAVGAIPAEA